MAVHSWINRGAPSTLSEEFPMHSRYLSRLPPPPPPPPLLPKSLSSRPNLPTVSTFQCQSSPCMNLPSILQKDLSTPLGDEIFVPPSSSTPLHTPSGNTSDESLQPLASTPPPHDAKIEVYNTFLNFKHTRSDRRIPDVRKSMSVPDTFNDNWDLLMRELSKLNFPSKNPPENERKLRRRSQARVLSDDMEGGEGGGAQEDGLEGNEENGQAQVESLEWEDMPAISIFGAETLTPRGSSNGSEADICEGVSTGRKSNELSVNWTDSGYGLEQSSGLGTSRRGDNLSTFKVSSPVKGKVVVEYLPSPFMLSGSCSPLTRPRHTDCPSTPAFSIATPSISQSDDFPLEKKEKGRNPSFNVNLKIPLRVCSRSSSSADIDGGVEGDGVCEESTVIFDVDYITSSLAKNINILPEEHLTSNLIDFIPSDDEGDLLSVGSIFHDNGECKACIFFHHPNKMCSNGARCLFCHAEHEPKVRKKSKKKKSKKKRENVE